MDIGYLIAEVIHMKCCKYVFVTENAVKLEAGSHLRRIDTVTAYLSKGLLKEPISIRLPSGSAI